MPYFAVHSQLSGHFRSLGVNTVIRQKYYLTLATGRVWLISYTGVTNYRCTNCLRQAIKRTILHLFLLKIMVTRFIALIH